MYFYPTLSPPIESEFGSTESIGYSVNSGSKLETSISFFTKGINGGLYSFFNNVSQFTFKNQGFSLTNLNIYFFILLS